MNAPVLTPLLTSASFDIDLLNVMLAEVASTAALRVRLQSAAPKDLRSSVASWSAPVANLIGGQIEYRFHLNDASKDLKVDTARFRLNNLNSDPTSPTVSIKNVNGAPVLSASLNFVTPAQLKSLTTAVPDIDIEDFDITVSVDFNGAVTPKAIVRASVSDIDWDVSNDVESNVEDAIHTELGAQGLTPDKIKAIVDRFFQSLLRFDGVIHQYAIEGDALKVTYYQVPFKHLPVVGTK
jgi:hypothetical protein